jgi:hypothetical protein
VVVLGDRGTIRWRYRFGEGGGRIVEALGYVKTPEPVVRPA